MNLFGLGKKKFPRRPRKKISGEEKAARIAAKELEVLSVDPEVGSEVRAQLLQKHHGIIIKPKDSVQLSKQKIRDAAYSKLEGKITGDSGEVITPEMEESMLSEILGSDSAQGQRGNYGDYYGAPGGGFEPPNSSDIIESYNQMKQEFGGGGSGPLGFLTQPGVALELLRTVQRMFPERGVAPVDNGGVGVIVVEINGKSMRMTEEGYNLYLKQKRELELKSGGKIDIPPPPGTELNLKEGQDGDISTVSSSSKPESEGKVEVDVQSYLPFAKTISDAMTGTPQQFVDTLIQEAGDGVLESGTLLSFLSITDYDTLLGMISPFKDNELVIDYIQKMIDNRGWVEEVLEIIGQVGQ